MTESTGNEIERCWYEKEIPCEFVRPLVNIRSRERPAGVSLYLPTQIRFPIGGERVTCHGSKLTDSLGGKKLTNSRGNRGVGETNFTVSLAVIIILVTTLDGWDARQSYPICKRQFTPTIYIYLVLFVQRIKNAFWPIHRPSVAW